MNRLILLSAAILVCSLLMLAGCGTKTAPPASPPTEPAPAAQPSTPAVQSPAPAAQPSASAAQEYTCPMHPQVRAAQPGKCPKCGMNLVPVAKPSAAVPAEQTMCPVMSGAINKSIFVDHNGRRIYFCCGGCPEVFAKDPARYLKVLDAAVPKPQTGAVPLVPVAKPSAAVPAAQPLTPAVQSPAPAAQPSNPCH
ncbi:MAG: heavy metal-binding domain-containing protein [Planctomycetota bacterium]